MLHIALVERPAAAAQYLHELQYDSGVAQLVCPQQRQRVDLAAIGEALTEETVKLAVQLREIRDVQPCADLVAALAHDLRHALRLLVQHAVRARLYDPGLLFGDLLDSISEHSRVVKADVHDNAGFRRLDNVRRIEPPSEPDLEHNDVTVLLLEPDHGRGGHKLKLRRVIGHRVGRDLHERHIRREYIVVDLLAVYLHALIESVKIGRSEKPGLVACRLEYRRRHRSAAALAVCPGDVNKLHPVLRVPELLQKLRDAFEPRPRAEPLCPIYIFKRFLIIHTYHILCVYLMIITMTITPIRSRGKGKSVLFSFSLRKKVIDRMDVLCYIMYYLSDERSIFVRIFACCQSCPSNTGRQCPSPFTAGK